MKFDYKTPKYFSIIFPIIAGSIYLHLAYPDGLIFPFEKHFLNGIFDLIGMLGIFYYIYQLRDEITVKINRHNHSPVSIWIRIDSIEKDDDGESFNFTMINVHCIWMKNLPRVGEFIDIGSIISDQYDLYLGDNLAGLEIEQVHHNYDDTLLECKIIEDSSNNIKAFFEEIAESLISLENTAVKDSFGKKVAEGNEMSINHYPVLIRYKCNRLNYEVLKPELDPSDKE